MKGYADLADLPEDERIRLIAKTAEISVVGFFVDDDGEKADRYIRKLAAYPVRVIDQKPGLVAGTIMVRVGPKES